MDADELQSELNRLWARVSLDPGEELLGPLPLPSPEIDSHSRAATMDALHLLRRQRESETAQLQHLLAIKERAASELGDRVKAAQAEILELKRADGRRERQVLTEMLGVSAKLENAQAALQEQEARYAQEERVLRDIAEKTRQQLAAETARWRELERQWNEREQQYLLDVKEAQAGLAKAEEHEGRADERARRLADDLKSAKGAVEATLAELLAERKLRDAADQERERALKKVAEVEEHFQELQRIWQEERKQWQELWDRERSGWEARQSELASWEERLRREREAWAAERKTREEAELRYAQEMAKNLRESSEASSQMAGTMRGWLAAAPPAVAAFPLRRVLAAVAAAALAAGLGLPVWRYATRTRLVPVAAQAVPAENATALAFDGNLLWLAEWSGRLLALDPNDPSRVLTASQVAGAGAYHPSALAVSGDTLWSIDTAQARILRHSAADPSVPRDSWLAPGPAPLALAHDGRHLWSFDAVNRTLYRHHGEGPQADVRAFPVSLDVVPTSMQWSGQDLWLHDSKSRSLLRLKVLESAVELVETVPLARSLGVVSIAVHRGPRGRVLWALVGGSGGASAFSVQRFELGGR
ncbi:MAG: hypothetical protein HY554_13355 [Elusimicrobia bacterium]|nr:hypothetical protein [Elusimicrobiota bacterium]